MSPDSHCRPTNLQLAVAADYVVVADTLPAPGSVPVVNLQRTYVHTRLRGRTVYNYEIGIGIPNLYTMVMARDLTASEDDVDMSELTQIKMHIGVLDNYTDFTPGSSQRTFSEDFLLELP